MPEAPPHPGEEAGRGPATPRCGPRGGRGGIALVRPLQARKLPCRAGAQRLLVGYHQVLEYRSEAASGSTGLDWPWKIGVGPTKNEPFNSPVSRLLVESQRSWAVSNEAGLVYAYKLLDSLAESGINYGTASSLERRGSFPPFSTTTGLAPRAHAEMAVLATSKLVRQPHLRWQVVSPRWTRRFGAPHPSSDKLSRCPWQSMLRGGRARRFWSQPGSKAIAFILSEPLRGPLRLRCRWS